MNSCSLERSFLIRFPNGDNDVTVTLQKGSLVEDLITKVKFIPPFRQSFFAADS